VSAGPDRFAAAWAAADGVEGWLTQEQARRLWDAAAALSPAARIVEIGSFRGRSAIVLALAAAEGVEVVCVDPHLGSDRGPQEIAARPALGAADLAAFEANLARAGVAGRVRHVRALSQAALAEVDGHVDVLFVDGAHRFGPARADLAEWGARVFPRGRMLVHDAFSSVGVTLALLRTTTFSGRWRYLGRCGSLAEYAREDVRGWSRTFNATRQLAQLPWFVRNLALKLATLLRLRRGRPWPY
jgi:predicted O-methyltransferase YrrM